MKCVAFVMACGLMSLAPVARADGCPEAQAERLRGAFAQAEASARRCMGVDSDDVGSWFELSRALGYQRQFPEALHWVERGLERYPADTDLSLWRVRLLAWSGRFPEARSSLTEVLARAPELRRDRETAMLEPDLDYWARDWAAAGEGFSRYLTSFPDDADALRKRGITWLERGDEVHAEADLSAACRIAGPGSPACRDLEYRQHEAARVTTLVEAAGATSPRGDELRSRIGVTARVWRTLRIGVDGELRLRDVGGALLRDTVMTVQANLRERRWALDAGVGAGLGVTFSPEVSAWVEPAVGLTDKLWLRAKAWRIAFADAGAWVIAPGLSLDADPVSVDVTYYLGLDDAGDVTHAGLLRTHLALGAWTFELGAGLGTASDYLDVTASAADGHWLVLAGLAWSPAWNQRVRLGYSFRHESAGESLGNDRHELGLGWQMTW